MSDELIHQELRFHAYGSYLRRRFGCRVSKVNVDAGFTCPNRDGTRGTGGCSYCNNSSFSPAGTQPQVPLEEQMAAGMAYHRHRLGSQKFIIYFQKFTNTYAPVERLRDLYARALAHPDVLGISIGTRPDALPDEALELLTELAQRHYVCLELGLQSMDDAILARINRGHTFAEYLAAVERVAGRGIELCTHLIHGFPGETREDFLPTAELLAELPVASVKLHQLHAVAGTPLAELYRQGEFVPPEPPGVCGNRLRLPGAAAGPDQHPEALRLGTGGDPGGPPVGPEEQPDVVLGGPRIAETWYLAGVPAGRATGRRRPLSTLAPRET